MKNISIKIQILTLVVSSLVLLAFILTIASVSKSKDALVKQSYATLTSIRDSKANQIQNFFSERVGDINVIAHSKNLKDLIADLILVHEELQVSANNSYPVKNPLAIQKTAPHEAFF